MKQTLTKKTAKKSVKNSQFFKAQAGFTLLEVLIAMLIAATMFSVAVLAFKDNEAARLKTKAYQLIGLLQVAQEESILRGVELGLRVENEKYYFMLYDGNKWQPLNEHALLKEVKFDEPVKLYVNVEGQESLLANAAVETEGSEKDSNTEQAQVELNEQRSKRLVTPQVFMLSSGDMNEFTLTIGLDRDAPIFYRIKGNFLGDMSISRAIDGHFRHDWDIELESETQHSD
ncbi:MAG: type II secretion system minor pseudopilin GspH [Kangiellaceae bacterium]|nr:type II secretion system minor pseudopilin GspH [Kangiellaceae bacterium]